ncbi:amidohydrolase family protein [Rhodopirellula sp. P2]|uniref:amidohydrolase family protein n=1 Tax=Rhodopirellula sp. P2 TaxID=2127060 RepID=UPI002368B21F|nr:amidohydrolase family protein [Rhodopirellula sp. P2]WDQ18335.1 amidohydrolase family protein [Rhodopirellula sp. P2]
MHHSSKQTYRARWLLPIDGDPIPNGMIVVDSGIMTLIRPFQDSQVEGDLVDLGDVGILPGLVNAHTHLEFSDLAQPIGQAGMELADWIREVIATRGMVDTDTRQKHVLKGHAEATGSGTQLIADIVTTPLETIPRNTIAFAEVLGLSQARGDERMAQAEQHLEKNASPDLQRRPAAISPHAPYSTPLPLLNRCIETAKRLQVLLAMHVAESPAERELLNHGTGPFAESLHALGLPVDQFFPWAAPSPLVHLIDLLGEAPRTLIVHGNDLNESEIQRIASHPNCSVVYCPRTHHFFGHSQHPVAELQAAGINVALGTDSRASNPDLNLWSEAQHLLRHRQDLSPTQVLRMATANGAEALGRSTTHGRLAVGMPANFITVATQADRVDQLWSDFSSNSSSSARPAPHN